MGAAATGPAPGSSVGRGARDAARASRRTASHSLRVAAVFSDGMVLQRGRDVAVFGTAPTGSRIDVEIGRAAPGPAGGAFVGVGHGHATAGADGTWSATLPPMPAGGPYALRVTGADGRLDYHDVYVGEVWLAGGQSNMELELRNSLRPSEAIAASRDPLLRFYDTPKAGEVDPAAEDASCWRSAAPDTVGTMSAVAYYAARRLRAALGSGVPVGIIDCYVGGTSVTCWMSEETLLRSHAGRGYLDRYHAQIAGRTDAACRAAFAAWQAASDAWNGKVAAARAADPDITQAELDARLGACPWPPPMTPFSQFRPTGPYGAMLRRIAPYTIRGCMWYQGEEDEAHSDGYRRLLGDMIGEWRGLWRDRDLPFLLVQLPRWSERTADGATAPNHWPAIREAQRDASATIPGVHLVPIIDCGEYDNIHPLDKRTVGERLAATALRTVYGREGYAVDGPVCVGAEARPEGRVVLRFDHDAGLHFGHYNGDSLGTDVAVPLGEPTGDPALRRACDSGFEIAGDDGLWVPAAARVTDDGVTLDAPGAPAPKTVRYAWSPWGPAPLFNDVGGVRLPAAPFRVTVRS